MNEEEANNQVNLFQNQLQQELQIIIEEHNKQMNEEIERMNKKKQELRTQFEEEMKMLREEYSNQIEKEKHIQEKSCEISKQVYQLQIDEAMNQKESTGGINNYSIIFDRDVNKLINKLEEFVKKMKHIPKEFQNEEEYQRLRSIYNQQKIILIKMLNIMKHSCHQELKQLYYKHFIIDKTYYNFFCSSIEEDNDLKE